MPGAGGRSKYFFFNKKRRERGKVHSSQVIPTEEKKQKNILEFFGGGKRKEPNEHEQTESASGDCKRSRKADFQKDEASQRIGEKLDEFRARHGSVDTGFSYLMQGSDVPHVPSIVRNGDSVDNEQDVTSTNPTPLEKQACKSYTSLDFVANIISLLGH